MFKIDLTENKMMLTALLNTNTTMLFMDGRLCSLHKHGMCMVVYENEEIEVEEPIVSDMSTLDNVLRSKTITSALIKPEEGKIFITHPYRWTPVIPRLRDDEYISKARRQLKNMEKLEKAKKTWKDRKGRSHKIARFDIDNILLDDVIRRLGAPESLELKTGKSLTITNQKSGEKVSLDDIESRKTKILLSKQGRDLLLDSLLGDESIIVIANKVVMLIENDIRMILAGRIPD